MQSLLFEWLRQVEDLVEYVNQQSNVQGVNYQKLTIFQS